MQLFVRTLAGKVITLNCEKSDTVESLKAKVEEKEGILPESREEVADEEEEDEEDEEDPTDDVDEEGAAEEEAGAANRS